MNKFYKTLIVLLLVFTCILPASTSHSSNSELIKLVKQQQYLAKKVSKHYKDFHADKKNHAKKQKMKNSIQSFHQNHLKLIKHRSNTKLINQKLTRVDEIWKIAYKLSETKKHDSMIRTAMNDISGKMEELRKLYSKTSK